jgi:hypothetical protein
MSKRPILKLNAAFFPLATSSWTDIVVNIFSGAAHPLDIWYAQNEDGTYDETTVEYFNVVKNWKEWSLLPMFIPLPVLFACLVLLWLPVITK